MIHHIEHHIGRLREKPEHTRKRVAFFTSLAITLIIFIVWIASYSISSTSVSESQVNAKTPISSLTASVGDVFGYIKDMFTGSNKAEYTAMPIEVGAGKR